MAGQTYYVSGTGDDKNNGLNEGAAFRSLGRAVWGMKAGDTLYVMNGTYDKGCGLYDLNGSEDNWTTIKAYPGHTPKIETTGGGINVFSSSYVRIEGLTLLGNRENISREYAMAEKDNLNNPLTNANGIQVAVWTNSQGVLGTNPHHIVITGNTVRNFPGGGIAFSDSDYITVEKNIVSGNAWYSPYGTQGITALRSFNFDNNTTDYRIKFIDNVVYDNKNLVPWKDAGKITEGHGLMLDTVNQAQGGQFYSGKALIANNVTYNNGGSGINVFRASNVDVVNNTVYKNGLVLTKSGEINASYSENVFAQNNILYASDNQNANLINYAKNVTFDNNLIYNSSQFKASDNPKAQVGSNILGKDPVFVDAANKNFQLKAGSAAIDAGSSLFNKININVPIDGDGNGSALIDIGAHEFGTKATPEIQVLNGAFEIADGSTTAIDFGNVVVGGSLTKTFNIRNTGTAALNLSNLQVSKGFNLVGTLPSTVAVNGSVSLCVGLDTTTDGPHVGKVSFNNNDINESLFDFAISGTVYTAPEIQVLNDKVDIVDGSTSAIDFGETPAGSNLIKTFTIQNIGSAALDLTNLVIPYGFSLVGDMPKTIAAKASATLSVGLNMTTPGTYSGKLSFDNNDSDEGPFNFVINGKVNPAPEIQVFNGALDVVDGSTTAIDFGNSAVGGTLTKTFLIRNLGTAALNLTNLQLPKGFSLVGTLPDSIAANKASASLSIALDTTTPGIYGGNFSLTNNDSDESPFDFAISGTVNPTPEIEVLNGKVDIVDGSTTAIDFGDIAVGGMLTKTFTINNTGTAALNLSNLYLPYGFSLVGTLPNSIAAKDSVTLSVGLNTNAPGTYTGNFTLMNNDTNENPFNFVISGKVNPAPEIQVFNGALDVVDGSTTAIDFGNVTAGGTLTKTFIIRNLGTAALNLSNLQLPKGFSLVGTLPDTIAPNKATAPLSIAVDTTIPGTYTGKLSLTNNDSDESPFDFAISGTVNPKVQGGNGNDLLIGGQGNDILVGGLGADSFVFNTNAAFTSAAVGIDTISDFNRSQGDKIVLDKTTFNAITSAVGTGFSNASDFQITSLGATSNAAIVYDSMSGQLFYNQNGSAAGFGSGGQFAQLTGKPSLAASDFMIQA